MTVKRRRLPGRCSVQMTAGGKLMLRVSGLDAAAFAALVQEESGRSPPARLRQRRPAERLERSEQLAAMLGEAVPRTEAYRALHLNPTAPAPMIRAAVEALVQLHADDPEALAQIKEAYRLLSEGADAAE